MSTGFKVSLLVVAIGAAVGYYIMNAPDKGLSAEEEARARASVKAIQPKAKSQQNVATGTEVSASTPPGEASSIPSAPNTVDSEVGAMSNGAAPAPASETAHSTN